MSQNSNATSGGTSILGLLGIAFIVLKLTGYIDWSWWYVTLPFWGGFALFIAVFALWVLYFIVKETFFRGKKDA